MPWAKARYEELKADPSLTEVNARDEALQALPQRGLRTPSAELGQGPLRLPPRRLARARGGLRPETLELLQRVESPGRERADSRTSAGLDRPSAGHGRRELRRRTPGIGRWRRSSSSGAKWWESHTQAWPMTLTEACFESWVLREDPTGSLRELGDPWPLRGTASRSATASCPSPAIRRWSGSPTSPRARGSRRP